MKHRFERALDLVTRDRFAAIDAVVVVAEIIGVLLAGAAGRPAGGQGTPARTTGDKASKREVGANIAARRRLGAALQAVLDFLKGLARDQALVFGLAKRNLPFGHFDVSRIGDAGEQVVDTLIADFSVGQVLGIFGLGLEEALDLDLAGKTPGCITFERFLHDRGQRLVAHQHFAVAVALLVFVADRRGEDVIAVEAARLHPVQGLLGILAALVLRDRSQDIFVKLAVGVIAQFDRGGFQNAAGPRDRLPQFEVNTHIAGKTRQIVNDDDTRVLAVGLQIGEQRHQAGTIGAAPGQIVGEQALDGIPLIGRILPASGLL
nr:hypothetical protein [Nitratireductor arenosus]